MLKKNFKICQFHYSKFQVCFGVLWCVFHISATTALLTKYSSIPVLVATAIFSYLSGFMHLAQALILLKAVKVTQIARQAVYLGNSIIGKQQQTNYEETTNEAVAYAKNKDNVVMDPTQTVY